MLYGYTPGGNTKKDTYCRCRCDCGNEHIISAWRLQNRANVSCGCMSSYYRSLHNRTNEIGQKFGRLTIIGIDYSRRPSKAICKCDCGSEIIASKADVVAGHTRSCGCLQSEMTSASNLKDFSGFVSSYGVSIKNRAYQSARGVWMWNCICPSCGKEFVALPAKIISGHTTSCGCKIQSSRERLIESVLKNNKIKYEKQKRFSDCRYHYTLPFDFAIYNNDGSLNCLIEYDGKQHYEPSDFFGGSEAFRLTQIRDAVKDNYCKSNDIPLKRLRYELTDEEIKNFITNTIYP